MNVRVLILLAALCCASFAVSCQGGSKYPEAWQTDEVEVTSSRLLWEVTMFALEKERFPIGSQLDPTTLTAISGWRNSLAPFTNKGYRERAEVRYDALGPHLYRVRVRVERETNKDHVRPMDLSYAKWEPAPDNQQAAMVLIQRVRSWIAPSLEMKSPKLSPAKNG